MTREDLSNRYFEWLCRLHTIDFEIVINMDQNRAEDGIDLRYRFGNDEGYIQPMIASFLDIVPCSILEMMVALSIQCENIMSDPEKGNRLGKWFWSMIDSLGLGILDDDHFDEGYARYVIGKFLNRDYSRDGEGGLFTIKNCEYDLRKVEIWHQMCLYLDTTLNI